MAMTKKQALEICKDLWQWLADNPMRDKVEWPGWNKLREKYGRFVHSCPCCSYVQQEQGQKGLDFSCDGKLCPLGGFAWEKVSFGCECGSPFENWKIYQGYDTDVSSPDLAAEEALKIVRACDTAINDLELKGE